MNKLHWNFEVGGMQHSGWLRLDVELAKYKDHSYDLHTKQLLDIYRHPPTNLLARYIEPYLEWAVNVSYIAAPEIKKLWEKQCPLQGMDEGWMVTEAAIVAPEELFKQLHDRLLEFDGQLRYSICI